MSRTEGDVLFDKFLQDKGFIDFVGRGVSGATSVPTATPLGSVPVPLVTEKPFNYGEELDKRFDTFIQQKGWSVQNELTPWDKAQEQARREQAAKETAALPALKATTEKMFGPPAPGGITPAMPFNPALQQTGTMTDPKTGEVVPKLEFTPPTTFERGVFKQIADEYDYRVKNQTGDFETLNDMVKGLTLGNLDAGQIINWVNKGISGIVGGKYRLAPTQEEMLQAEKEQLGYIPQKGKAVFKTAATLAGAAPTMYLAGAAGFGAGAAVSSVPIISQLLVPSLVSGVITGLAQKPGGVDNITERFKDVPGNVLAWTGFNVLGLGINKLADMIGWNMTYRGKIAGTGKGGGFKAAEEVAFEPQMVGGKPAVTKTEFSAEEIRSILDKQNLGQPLEGWEQKALNDIQAKAAQRFTRRQIEDALNRVQRGAEPGPNDKEILEAIKGGHAWKIAAQKGWIPDEPVNIPGQGGTVVGYKTKFTGKTIPPTTAAGEPIPPKPSWADLFRTPGEPWPSAYPAGQPTAAPPGETPSTATPIAALPGNPPPQAPGATIPPGPPPTPAQPTIAAPGPPEGVPEANTRALGMGPNERTLSTENLAKRGIIDKAINGTATPYETDLARGFLEHPKFNGVGNAQLASIVERVKKPPFTIRFDVRDLRDINTELGHDKADQLVLTPIQEEMQKLNPGNNPLDWKGMWIGGDELQAFADTPQAAEDIAKGIYTRLQDVALPSGKKVYLDYGIGTTPEEADANLYKFKNANKRPVIGVTPTATGGTLFPTTGTAVPTAEVPPVTPAAPINSRLKNYETTVSAPIPVTHWTLPENVPQIYDKGFNTKIAPIHGTGGFTRKGFTSAQKYGRGVIYFTTDETRWNKGYKYVGVGAGDADGVVWDHGQQKMVTEPKSLKTLHLAPVEASIKPGSRVLVIDSLQKYLDAQNALIKSRYIRDKMPNFIKAAKKAGYDAVRVMDKPGAWNRAGAVQSSYSDATGNGGKDDWFIFNRNILDMPKAREYHVKKVLQSRIAAQQKRGRVGLPANAPKLWRDIMEITNGKGIKPPMNAKGEPMEEWKLIPQVLKSKNGLAYDEVQDALENDYHYKFDTEDIFSLLQKSDFQFDYGKAGAMDEADVEAQQQSEAAAQYEKDAEHYQSEVNKLKNPNEGDQDFWDRMTKEAAGSGFGEDVYGYVDSQISLYKAPGEPTGGQAAPEFKVVKARPTRIANQLPPQKRIPETGVYNAVRTDDNGLYFLTGPEDHYTIVKKLGIPAERVVGGGYIQDGVYTESPYSDAKRMGVIARAEKGMQEPAYEIKAADQETQTIDDKMKQANPVTPAEVGVLGETNSLALGKEKAIPMEMTVDATRAWNNAAKTKYGDVQLGDKGLQEAQQNAIDAVVMALKSGQIQKGKIHVEFRDGLLHIEDNGIGMSDEEVKNVFLSLYGTGKTAEGAIGNFGIGKAVILAPHDHATWTLVTRDNYVDTAIVAKKGGARTVPSIQGTKLTVKWPFEKEIGKEFYSEIMSGYAPFYVLLNSIPKDKIELTWNTKLRPSVEGGPQPHEFLLDKIEGVAQEAQGTDRIKFEIKYYPLPELQNLDAHWSVDLKLPPIGGYRDPSACLSKNVVYRIAHPSMPDVRLVQNIAHQWVDGFSGLLLVDILTDIKPEEAEYPLADNRQSFKSGSLNSQVSDIVRALSANPESSMRAAVKSTKAELKDRPEWRQTLDNVHKNPKMKQVRALIRSFKLPDGTPMKPLDLNRMRLKIDNGYVAELGGTEDNAIFMTVYDAVAKMLSAQIGAPYKELYAMLSATLNGGVVASEYGGDRMADKTQVGRLGLNHNLYRFDSRSMTNPSNCAQALMELVSHEFTHNWYPHGERFDIKFTENLLKAAVRLPDVMGLAEILTEAEFKPTRLKARVKSSSGRVREVPVDAVHDLTPGQLRLNLDQMEVNNVNSPTHNQGSTGDSTGPGGLEQDPPDSAINPEYAIRRVVSQQPGLFAQGEGRPGGPENRNRPGLNRPTGVPINRGAVEQPHPPGVAQGIAPGVGVREVPGGLTPPEEKPAPFKPAETYVPREGERAPQGILPMPEAAPLFEKAAATAQMEEPGPTPTLEPGQQGSLFLAEPRKVTEIPQTEKDHIAAEVKRLTTAPNFPHAWSSNTPEQIADNRQNVMLYTMQHYNPASGKLENFINKIKGFFVQGEVPTGQDTSEAIRRAVEGQFPVALTKAGTFQPIEFPTEANVFARGSRQPQFPDAQTPEEIEKAFEKEEVAILNLFADTAKKMAGGNSKLAARYNEILKSRLIPDLPESYQSIGDRLKVSEATVIADYQKLMGEIKDSPEIRDMIKRHMKQANLGPLPSEEDLRRLGDWIRKYFSTTKGATAAIDRQNDERIGAMMAAIFDQTLDSAVLKKFIKSQPDGVNDYMADLMTGAISGDGYADIMNSHLPEDVKSVLLRTRRRIDGLSELIKRYADLPRATQDLFDHNMGKYLSKAYRIYQDKRWAPTDAQRQGFADWLQREYGMTPAEATKFMEAELAKGRSKVRGPLGGKSKKIPTGNFRHRMGLSPEFKDFAGEILDVGWLTLHTVTHQAVEAFSGRFLTYLADHLPDLWTDDYEVAARNGWQNSKLGDNYGWGKLKGKYVSRELKEYLDREVNYAKSNAEEMITKFITQPFKWTKTIGSWPTHMRNFLGNTMFSPLVDNTVLNPLNWKYYWGSLMAHMGRTGSHRQIWSDMIRHGIVDTQFYGNDIMKIHRDIMDFNDPEWYDKIYDIAVKLPMDKLGELYNFEDSWYRVAAYLHYIDRGFTPEQAASEVNAGLQNYRKLPLAVDWLRRWPLLGPFISFKANTVVIIAKQANRAWEETHAPDPKTKAHGWYRLIRMALILSLPTIISEVSKKFYNVDEGQIKRLESYYPTYRKNGQFLYFRNADGKLKVFDMSYINPFGDLDRIFNATIGSVIRGQKPDIKSIQDATDFFSLPLMDAFQIAIKGEDPTYGTKYNTFAERAKAFFAYFYMPASMPVPNLGGLAQGKGFGPALSITKTPSGRIGEITRNEGQGNIRPGALTGPQFKAIIDAYNGAPDRYGRVRNLPEEVKNFFTGVRTWDVQPEALLAQAVRKCRSDMIQARDDYKTWVGRNLSAPKWEIEQHAKTMMETLDQLAKQINEIGDLAKEMEKDNFLAHKNRW